MLPCIDIDECTEVVDDKALIFRKSDTEDLREKLQLLCDEPHLVEQYRKNAVTYILGKHNWDDITDRTLDIYRSVCKRKK